jgi:hypothetical protein
MPIQVKLNRLQNAGPKQAAIAEQAVTLLQSALNHPEFKSRAMTAEYATWHQNDHGHTRELPVARVWQIIETGQELHTGKDYEIDLDVRLRRLFRPNVLGYTDIGGPTITTNTRFINQCIRHDDAASLASHWFHEWLHVAGFFHHGGNSTRGDVAYVLGDLIYDFIHEHLLFNADRI